MTVNSTINRIQYNGDDVTLVFPYTFKIFDEDDLTVVLTDATDVETILTITTHYSVSGVGEAAGGNVTMVTAPAAGEKLTIKRELDLLQETDYTTGGSFPAEDHEGALDKLCMQVQQLDEELGRALKVAISSTNTDLEVPDPSADRYLKWNSGATALENSALADLGDLTAHAADGNAHCADKTAVTIASGVATLANAKWYELSAESGVADALTKLAGLSAGDIVILTAATGHTITVTKGTDLRMPLNFPLTGYDTIMFLCIGSDVCLEISRSHNV